MIKHLLCLIILIISSVSVRAEPSISREITPCIHYETRQQGHIHISKIDLSCPSIRLLGTLPHNSDTTSNFAYKNKTTVAINASFFDENRNPLGLNYSHQRTWRTSKKDQKQYSFLACTKENQCLIEPFNQLTPYQKQWDIVISGWQSLQNGLYRCAPSSPAICHRNAKSRHPRTAVGLSQDKRFLYLVVVEGRLDKFKGYTLNQLAQLFKQLNVPHAINLDGGGSSTMVINNKRVNRLPSQQMFFERAVANHLGVVDEQ
ncbi:phosphodiester glycosidase family protein [Pelistega ratti]|uniref:phosphodiester glycosidase family protein n=1 Tax=Pelistega ratti TaxID=2652177 RepID=UPI001356E266|nr:phosphodiester glycosidase family protein [Pelistega ratti]